MADLADIKPGMCVRYNAETGFTFPFRSLHGHAGRVVRVLSTFFSAPVDVEFADGFIAECHQDEITVIEDGA